MKKLLIIFIVVLMTGCSIRGEDKLAGLKKQAQPKVFDMLYHEDIDKGKLVLYKDETGFRHAILPTGGKHWNISGNVEFYPEDGFVWGMTNDPNIPIATFAGVITNDSIQKVIVRQRTVSRQAKIINTEKGRFWFASFDELESSAGGSEDPLKIEALSDDGDVIWRDGIYDGKLQHGPVK